MGSGGGACHYCRRTKCECPAEPDTLREEVERLTRERDEARTDAVDNTHEAWELVAEVERLRAALTEISKVPRWRAEDSPAIARKAIAIRAKGEPSDAG